MDLMVSTRPERPTEWDALVDASPLPSPFLRSWWLDAWADDTARVLQVSDRGELVGGLALRSSRSLGLERIELGGHPLAPDHCDLLARPGYEEAVSAVVAGWLGRGRRRIRLDGLREGALLTAVLGSILAPPASAGVLDIALFEPLPADFATYLDGRSRSFRRNVLRYRRQAAANGLMHVTAAADETDRYLAHLRRLHTAAFGAASSFLPQFPAFARAARGAAARGEIVFHAAVDDTGRIVAIEVVFETAGRLSTYQGGRAVSDPRTRSIGTVLLSHAIEDAIGRGCTELDMLRGAQAYKASWAGGVRRVVAVSGAVGVLARAVDGSTASLRRLRRWSAAVGGRVSRSAPGARG